MKYLILLLMTLTLPLNAWALPPKVEADRLLLQGKAALDAKDYEQAVTSFSEAQSLDVKLPVTFHYDLGRALAGAGEFDDARANLEHYIEKAGTKGTFYKEALMALNDIDAAEKKRDADREAARNKYEKDLAEYERKVENCPRLFQEHLDFLEKQSLDALARCQRVSYCDPTYDSDFNAKRKEFLFTRRDGVDAYCENRYTKPEPPDFMQ